MRRKSTKVTETANLWRPLYEDRGVAIIVSLLVLVVLSLLGSVFLLVSRTESNIAANSRVATQAFYAAEAGIETALNQLPGTGAIAQTSLTNNIAFSVPPIVELGTSPNLPAGFNLANYSFNMYQITVSGTVVLPPSNMQLQLGATQGAPFARSGY